MQWSPTGNAFALGSSKCQPLAGTTHCYLSWQLKDNNASSASADKTRLLMPVYLSEERLQLLFSARVPVQALDTSAGVYYQRGCALILS